MKHKIRMNNHPVRYRESYGTYLVNTNMTPIGGRGSWLDLPVAGPKPVTVRKARKSR